MSIKITDGFMCLEVSGEVIAAATQRPDGWWEVTCWPGSFDHNQAITTLTVTELLASGYSSDDPVVMALREELR